MLEFTVVTRHDTDLAEHLWNMGMHGTSKELSDLYDFCEESCEELGEAFEEAIEEVSDFEFGYEIDEDDLYDFIDSNEFEDLLEKTYGVAKELNKMEVEECELCVMLTEFLANCDPFDGLEIHSGEGKIDFYIETVDRFKNRPSELISLLKRMREDVDDGTEDAEAIDDFIEQIEEMIEEE